MKRSFMTLWVLLMLASTAVWSETLQWDAPVTGDVVTGHMLYWGPSGDVSNVVDIPGADVVSYALAETTFLQGEEYCFQLTAYNTTGESGKTSPVLCKVFDVKIPKIPAGLKLVSD